MKIHMVKKGETLYGLSQKYNVSLEELIKLNSDIANPDLLQVGMKVKIPSATPAPGMDIMHQHVVKQGDTLWKLSKAWGVPLADMIKANPQLKNPNVLLTGEVVNIPKATLGTVPAGTIGSGHHPLHPASIAQGVQGLVQKIPTLPIPGLPGKTPTAPIPSKPPTGPIEGKTPTAPIAPNPSPIPTPLPAPLPEKKPTEPVVTAPPVLPKPSPKPQPNPQPNPPKTMPVAEKPANKAPVQEANKPHVDLFQQYGIPATEVMSLYDIPNPPPQVSPVSQGYGNGPYGGYGNGPYEGYGNAAMPNVSPMHHGGNDPYPIPPGMVPIDSYGNQAAPWEQGPNAQWSPGPNGPWEQALAQGLLSGNPNLSPSVQPAGTPDYGNAYLYGQGQVGGVMGGYPYGNAPSFTAGQSGAGNDMLAPAHANAGYPNPMHPAYGAYGGNGYYPWPQTAGAGAEKAPCNCGCGDKRDNSEWSESEEAVIEASPKSIKSGVKRKSAKKAAVRSVTSRPKTKKRVSLPWINR
ncbi:LysM peptidoglycan-binding domain-containing protein [Paenibacillus sp. GCM10023252]|uniref:LysM peptidoglycan-binding domain-containing protein n=1 Tax=Paenibacillus sp. GCM10023252 TaxID=3252649 RepID=UPI00361D345F